VFNNHTGIAQALINAGANPNLQEEVSGRAPENYTVVLFNAAAKQTQDGGTALMTAVMHNHIATVLMLIQAGANPNLVSVSSPNT
jgi:ankyrin repeat protein